MPDLRCLLDCTRTSGTSFKVDIARKFFTTKIIHCRFILFFATFRSGKREIEQNGKSRWRNFRRKWRENFLRNISAILYNLFLL